MTSATKASFANEMFLLVELSLLSVFRIDLVTTSLSGLVGSWPDLITAFLVTVVDVFCLEAALLGDAKSSILYLKKKQQKSSAIHLVSLSNITSSQESDSKTTSIIFN